MVYNLVCHWIANVGECREIQEKCVLVDVLDTAKERKGLTALNLAKLKAFFDREAAMDWQKTATPE